jgi:hypothetical protein
MVTGAGKKSSWTEIGRSTTTPTTDTKRKEVKVDDYYVVVGFEVNNSDAFKDQTHDLAADYGHAFFYVVKNQVVASIFSFGPGEFGKDGWFGKGNSSTPNMYNVGAVIKNRYNNSRLGKSNYGVTEVVNGYKVPLTLTQGVLLIAENEKMRTKVALGKERYTAYLNDTCAETARDLLKSAGIDTPSGKGKVKHSGFVDLVVASATNPYMWQYNFSKTAFTHALLKINNPDPDQWIGGSDPLFP